MPNSRDDRRSSHPQGHYRSEDHRGGIYGSSGQSDRTYDPNRFRSDDTREALGRRNENYDRFRDYSRTYEENEHRYGRGSRDYGYGRYGMTSGFPSGAEYGGYGRGSDFGAFDRGDDLAFGGQWAQRGTGEIFDSPSISSDFEHIRDVNFVGRGPKGYRRLDARMIEDVCEVLERHPSVDATEIEVDVKDGVVTLRGWVENREQKRLAEFAVDEVSGIRDVINQLKFD